MMTEEWMHCISHDFLEKSKIKNMPTAHRNATVLHTRPVYESNCSAPFSGLCCQSLLLYWSVGCIQVELFKVCLHFLLFSRRLEESVISLASDHISVIILVLPLQFVTPGMLEDFTRDYSLYKRKRNWICEPSIFSPAGISIASYRQQWVTEALKHTQWSQHMFDHFQ